MHASSYINILYIIISLRIGFVIFKANNLPLRKQDMVKFDSVLKVGTIGLEIYSKIIFLT